MQSNLTETSGVSRSPRHCPRENNHLRTGFTHP